MGTVRWLCLLAACFAVGCGATNSTVATDADESTDTSVRHVETPTWRVRGNELMESGDFRGAIAVYDAAIPKECDIVALLFARGKALFRSGEYATAERDFQAALRIAPGDGRAWQGIGDCRIGQQDYRGGVDALTRAIAAGRRDAAVFASRGLANFYASRTIEALADQDEAVRLAPDDSSQRMQRGKLRYMLEDYASAIADFDARLEDQPADAEAWLQRAGCYAGLGYHSQAVVDAEEAVRHRPDDPLCYGYVGCIHLTVRDYLAAAEWFRRAADVDARRRAVTTADVPKKALTAEDLEFGRQQVRQMLRDRPMMAEHVREGDALWNWAARRFAGEATSGRLRWDNEPPDHFDSDAVLPESGEIGAIRIGAHERTGMRQSQPKSFSWAWSCFVFECFNHVAEQEFAEASRQIRSRSITADEFARRYMEIEEITSVRTLRFFCDVFLPWAHAAHLERVDPSDWHVLSWSPIDGPRRDVHFRRDGRWDQYLASAHEIAAYSLFEEFDRAAALKYLNDALADESLSPYVKARLCYFKAHYSTTLPEDADAVVASLSDAIHFDPGYVDALVARGNIYSNLQRRDEAFADFDSVVRAAPDLPDGYGLRGNWWYEQGNLDRALADYGRIIELSPNDPGGYAARAAVWRAKGDPRAELADWDRCAELGPDQAYVHFHRAEVYCLSQDANVRNGALAVEAAMRSCELTKWEDASSIALLAAAHAEAGREDEAVKWQRKAVEMTPEANRRPVEAVLRIYEAGKTLRDAPLPPQTAE